MINRLHAALHNPQSGWDPISASYANAYSEHEWCTGVDNGLIELVDLWVGDLSNKRILDLGGGPGLYSIYFASKGASVTWLDVSNNYMEIASQKARERGVKIDFRLGYMDTAYRLYNQEFDLVFNRLCWDYCWNDRMFARSIYESLKIGGIGIIDTLNMNWKGQSRTIGFRLRSKINKYSCLKIGHVYPPMGRLQSVFSSQRSGFIFADKRDVERDRLVFQRGNQ